MKKLLRKAILPAMVAMTLTGTTYAASFTDVPKDHWAYASVNQLVKAGLVDGYSDGSFKGDKTISRFEMAIIVGKAIDRFDKADEADKKEIDRLSAEFAGELNRMGVRIAKVEAKTNVWAGGETRFRYVANNPQASGEKKLRGSDSFQFRQRVKLWGTINENISWFARLTASGQAGNYSSATSPDGTTAGFDIFAITAKKQLGFDSIRAGRFPLDSFGAGLMGKAIGVDGVRLDKKIGDVTFIGAVNNVKPLADLGTGTGTSGDAKTLSNAQLGWKMSDKLSWRAGYYWADVPGTATATGTGSMNVGLNGGFDNSHGWATGFTSKIGKYQLFGDYISSQLVGATANLPTNPKAWALELTNSTFSPPVFFSGVNLVNPVKKGTDAWMVSYRSVDPGALPDGAGGFDTMAVAYAGPTKPYSIMKGTDNVNVLYLAYQNVVAKNVVASLEYQDFKIKNRGLTALTSDNLDKTYMMKLEFFY